MPGRDRPSISLETSPDAEKRDLMAAIVSARGEFEAARSYFNFVTEPELVEHAILRLAAAERRYNYVLRQARRIGLRQSVRLDG